MFYVLSLGGSIVSLPTGPDIMFLKKFKKLIEERVKRGDKFIIVVGGGSLAREYIRGADKIEKGIDSESKDYLGIYATYLNSLLVKTIFKDLAYEKIIFDPGLKIRSKKPIFFAGGYKPGNSSDFMAVLLAETYGVKEVINLSNIDYVYNKDPNKHLDAIKIKNIKWNDFLSLVGPDWKPGMNAPFDPIASKRCQKKRKKVVVLNGSNLKNLSKYFSGKGFKGTIIED
jgi:uridylate kinase